MGNAYLDLCEKFIKVRFDNHTYTRHIMSNDFEKGWKAAQSSRELNKLFDEGTIRNGRCREWFACSKSGETSLEDKPGRERNLENSNAGRQLQCGPFNCRTYVLDIVCKENPKNLHLEHINSNVIDLID
uniref:HTH_48 domain-containing protein n=1 Tax=Glossina pallidipes TaxID=7398 RepID=A0A1B0AAI4_GLOPL